MLSADIGTRFENGINVLADWLPRLVGALVILLIAWIVARLVGRIVGALLHRAGFDRALSSGSAGQFIEKVTAYPSRLVGRIAFWAVFLSGISLAVSVLGIAALKDFVAAVWAYVPNVIAAVLIFLIAGAISAAVAALVQRLMGDTPTGKIIATVVPIIVMAIAVFMILDQLKIASTIVTITYAALMGAVALGMALAFGLGGRDVAARMLEGAYAKGQQGREQMRRDVQQGRERAQQQAAQAKERFQGGDTEGDTIAGPPSRLDADEPVVFEPDPSLESRIDRPGSTSSG